MGHLDLMRVLLTTPPDRGHLFPMVPLAWALRCAGHQILVSGPDSIAETVRGAGLAHAPVGSTVPDLCSGTQEPGPHQDHTAQHWIELAEHSVAETVDLVGQWRPQVVISDYTEYSGPIAAALSGIPSVVHHRGLHLSENRTAELFSGDALQQLHALQEQFGLLPEETAPTATVDLCPSSLHRFDSSGWLAMRHIPYGGMGSSLPWLWAPRARPRVCVSLGSVPSLSRTDRLRAVAEELSAFDGEIIITGVDSHHPPLAGLPEHIRTVAWLPHDQVFPTCDVVIHHGGSGSSMNALRFGLPQLLLPRRYDHSENAERLVDSGAALSIETEDRAGGLVRQEVEQLLTERSYRDHARRIRAEIEEMPAPGQVVATLETLAESGNTRARAQPVPDLTLAPAQ